MTHHNPPTTMARGAHALLLTKDHRVLLVPKGAQYQHDARNAGKVAMFGGGVEAGENPMTALKRELMEELELASDETTYTFLNTYHKTLETDGVEVMVYVYVVYGVDMTHCTLHEGDQIVCGSPTELLARPDLTRITRLALQDLIASPRMRTQDTPSPVVDKHASIGYNALDIN